MDPLLADGRKKNYMYSNTTNCNTKTKSSENVDETFLTKVKHFHMDRK